MSNEMDEGTKFILDSAVSDLVAMIKAIPVDELLEDGDLLQATFIFEGKRDLELVATEGEFPTFDWHILQDGSLGVSSNVFLGKYIKPTEK